MVLIDLKLDVPIVYHLPLLVVSYHKILLAHILRRVLSEHRLPNYLCFLKTRVNLIIFFEKGQKVNCHYSTGCKPGIL